ncbi:MAG: NAD(P)-dependent oxidoreductase [Desulfobacteraceae bacterium]|jgi:dTDP-4-dehydrorhamnose reductase|nr:MAG: NAD(P)-dependent oxidoreductase [Desulfobacteraceae bacterium]
MKIILVGADSMLGRDCREVLSRKHIVLTPAKREMDITRWDIVTDAMADMSPDVVINCAEEDDLDLFENNDPMLWKLNVEGARNLAQSSSRFDFKMVHLSSYHVFDGTKKLPQPYFEDDTPRPISKYGRSKVESEVAVRQNTADYLIVRTGWLYGGTSMGIMTNYLLNVIKNPSAGLQICSDDVGSPTWTLRIAMQIERLLEADARGTYHITAEGHCNKSEYGYFICKHLGLSLTSDSSRIRDDFRKDLRPRNCILDNRRLRGENLSVMKNWGVDLKSFLNLQGKNILEIISF